ncbi:hypothetical protein, conserved [Leishmania tarentolae]|uniref:IPT/TIG domain-containing protein n=1 Tax=Leishmania tarentolae TaxID=5689 RepID=A0A640KR43_LEITA|nr:hypothetical protein, conserved [Leishmania tarentolae]
MPSLFGYRSSMFAVGWALLLAVVVVNPAVYAAPAVTGATCSGNDDGRWCNNSMLTLTGTDLASVKALRFGFPDAKQEQITCNDNFIATSTTISCTVVMTSASNAGLYPVALVLEDNKQVESGSLLLGALWDLPEMQIWTSTTPSSPHKVTGQSSDWPSTGDLWSISGTFDPNSQYSVFFYNTQQKAANGGPSPITCTQLVISDTNLSCIILAPKGAMGMHRFLVKDITKDALLLGSTSLWSIAVNPPMPAVTGAEGECATNSNACVDGATLTIKGINFNDRNHTYQKFFVGVTEVQRRAINLTPTSVGPDGVNVTLTVAHGTPAGSYPVFVKIQVCMMQMMSPVHYVGNLVLQSGTSAGFNTGMPTGHFSQTQSAVDDHHQGLSSGYVAVASLAVTFGALFLIVVVVLTVVCLRRSQRRYQQEGNRYWGSVASDMPAAVSEPHDLNNKTVVH